MRALRKTIGKVAAMISVVVAFVLFATCDSPLLAQIREASESSVSGPKLSVRSGESTFLSGQSIVFPWAYPEQPKSVTINLHNIGSEVLRLIGDERLKIEHDVGSAFSLVIPESDRIEPGDHLSLSVTFMASQPGPYESRLVIQSNDNGAALFELFLDGQCFGLGSIIYPVAGAAFSPAQLIEIVWAPFNVAGTVRLELLREGSFDSLISANASDSGVFDWLIPPNQIQGHSYQIRIIADSDGPTEVSDTFSIGRIDSVVPNGSEIFMPGTNQSITWQSGIGGYVNVELWNGDVLHQVIASAVSNVNQYSGWTVPELNDNGFRIRVISTVNSSIYAESDSTFAIGRISNVAPTGGALSPGWEVPITWDSGIGGNVSIELRQNGDSRGFIVLSTANNGTLSTWIVPQNASGTGNRIRVTSTENPSIFSESAESFPIGSISLSSPGTGERFDQGDTVSISWSSDLGGTVRIQLLRNDVPFGADIASTTSNSGDSSYHWAIPLHQKPGFTYRVRVSSHLNTDVYQDSPVFAIRGWDLYGETVGFAGVNTQIRMGVDVHGRPVVAYMDSGRSIQVKRWEENSWQSLGFPGDYKLPDPNLYSGPFFAMALRDDAGIAIAYNSGDFPDGNEWRLRLVDRVFSTWTDRGYSPGTGVFPAIITDYQNRSYVSSSDAGSGYFPGVSRLSGTTWNNLGVAKQSMGFMTSIALGNLINPIVAFMDMSSEPYGIEVHHRQIGGSWSAMGLVTGLEGGLFPTIVNQIGLTSPFICFVEGNDLSSYAGDIRVKQFDSGTTWVDLGSLGFGRQPHMTLNPYDAYRPYVVFQDFENGGKLRLMMHQAGWSWASLGLYERNMDHGAFHPIVSIDPIDGMPVVAFFDAAGYVYVVKRIH